MLILETWPNHADSVVISMTSRGEKKKKKQKKEKKNSVRTA